MRGLGYEEDVSIILKSKNSCPCLLLCFSFIVEGYKLVERVTLIVQRLLQIFQLTQAVHYFTSAIPDVRIRSIVQQRELSVTEHLQESSLKVVQFVKSQQRPPHRPMSTTLELILTKRVDVLDRLQPRQVI